MRPVYGICVIVFPAALLGQPRATTQAHAIVRSSAGARAVTTQVRVSGQLFAALDVARGPDGRRLGTIRLSGPGGTATTPADLAVSDAAGAVTFSAPKAGPDLDVRVQGTALHARGRSVRVVRDRAGGPLRVEAVPDTTR